MSDIKGTKDDKKEKGNSVNPNFGFVFLGALGALVVNESLGVYYES